MVKEKSRHRVQTEAQQDHVGLHVFIRWGDEDSVRVALVIWVGLCQFDSLKALFENVTYFSPQ